MNQDSQPEIEGLKPVAWRYCYQGDGRKIRWTLTQRPMQSQPARPGACAIVAEPLYTLSALLSLKEGGGLGSSIQRRTAYRGGKGAKRTLPQAIFHRRTPILPLPTR
jgi:hypothetical protein